MKNFAPWLGLCLGLVLSIGLSSIFGENPFHVLKILTTSFANSWYDLGLTLFYTTCFIFSGLAFAAPLKAGVFHIGSEGQILFSSFIASVCFYYLSPPNNSLIGMLMFLVGATLTVLSGVLSAQLIAALKIFKSAHEVIVAIMLNFILSALSVWFTVQHFQNPDSQNPETPIINNSFQFLKNDLLKNYLDQSPVSSFLFVALAVCIFMHLFEKKTLLGFQIRAYGENPSAAERLGISKNKIIFFSLGIAGFFSAMVALTEILGNSFQYKIGFSPQYGFLGIAVALLARQHYLGIIGSAFLLACLHKGSSDLDLETQFLTRDFSRVIQAIVIFSVSASYYLFNFKQIGKK